MRFSRVLKFFVILRVAKFEGPYWWLMDLMWTEVWSWPWSMWTSPLQGILATTYEKYLVKFLEFILEWNSLGNKICLYYYKADRALGDSISYCTVTVHEWIWALPEVWLKSGQTFALATSAPLPALPHNYYNKIIFNWSQVEYHKQYCQHQII